MHYTCYQCGIPARYVIWQKGTETHYFCKIHYEARMSKKDTINPSHYKEHPSKIECIQITEHMNFNLGNAVKYIWRAGLKHDKPIEDLKKAAWYLNREIERLTKMVKKD